MSPVLLDHRQRPRVAVTGMGVKTPAGLDLDTFWAAVHDARPVAATVPGFVDEGLSVTFACTVPDEFDPVAYVGPKDARRQDRVTQLGFAAAADAIEDAGELGSDPERCAVIAATGNGGLGMGH